MSTRTKKYTDRETGEDYKQIPNDQKVQEIENYVPFLAEIKKAIGDKELSIAVPGKEGDLIAYTAENVPKIDEIVDHVNVRNTDRNTPRLLKPSNHHCNRS